MKHAIAVALLLGTFLAGAAVARAELGWDRLSAPCNVASLAINTNQIAVVCENDRSTILIKQR